MVKIARTQAKEQCRKRIRNYF
ncbi:unnamed protein product [Arabidopsis thaliana]|uniref:Uncharacterized protein n=2 Tax=Arabidopsis thaliana TaxID=3702 RepID=A0A654FC10_ARATH|nr:uncharacterized protein AT3G13404 [Arabidopsis thaliana]AEE75343.1 hypothetical protein AT3G13404 [Arabidopsis thaliana]VYS57232.1 unnamed protein product [Arabidopsis thaliana]|eukprot:NP_001336505.1 hypothetical protein AT3G13404 [Arabidopsis thaliana]